MLGGFVRRYLATLSPDELDQLEAILELPDVDLAEWLSGRHPVPAEARSPLLDRIVAESVVSGSGKPEHLR
ncbi:MAG: succinate dehydrogenase [Rubritepida sp.]|nr:succinate dehydrogenase [Rubritepida sp.]